MNIPDIGINLGLTEAGTVVGVMGVMAALKKYIPADMAPIGKLAAVFGLTFLASSGLAFAQGTFAWQSVVATTFIVGFGTLGAHQAQKNTIKSIRERDPRRP